MKAGLQLYLRTAGCCNSVNQLLIRAFYMDFPVLPSLLQSFFVDHILNLILSTDKVLICDHILRHFQEIPSCLNIQS